MKPRQHAPQTIEDFDVWEHVGRHFHRDFAWVELSNRARLHDRRDADLMNWAQTIRRVRDGGYRMLGPLDDRVSSADPNPIDYGGDISGYVR